MNSLLWNIAAQSLLPYLFKTSSAAQIEPNDFTCDYQISGISVQKPLHVASEYYAESRRERRASLDMRFLCVERRVIYSLGFQKRGLSASNTCLRPQITSRTANHHTGSYRGTPHRFLLAIGWQKARILSFVANKVGYSKDLSVRIAFWVSWFMDQDAGLGLVQDQV
jgi:hypothetical protein